MDKPCYLCGGISWGIREGIVRDNPDLDILECNRCGLVNLSSFDHISDEFYDNSGMHGFEGLAIDEWLALTKEDDERRFAMLSDSLVNKKILDFGCGNAGFLNYAKDVASEAFGIEREKRIIKHWENELEIVSEINDVEGDFDLITAFHVIEHLKDPREILIQLKEKMGKNAKLIVEVPNSDDALLSLYQSKEFSEFTYWSQHLYLFNGDTLKELVESAGFKVAKMSFFQRYPVSNHLHWLAKGTPGGHQQWDFLNNKELNNSYGKTLSAIGKTDTLIAYLEV